MQKGKTPFKKYGKITLNQWDKFVKFKTSPEEMAKSKRLSDLAKRKKWHHRLGSGGYARKIAQWNKEDEEMKKAGVPVPMEEWNIRSKHWVKERTPKITSEGKVLFEDPELQGVADKIEDLSSKEKKGEFIPQREKDVLSQALGNREHGGRVRGVSSKLSWKEGFKQDASSYKRRDAYKESLRDEGGKKFEKQMMGFCIRHFLLPKTEEETQQPEPNYPFDDLEETTPCRLHVPSGRAGRRLEATTEIAIPGRTYHDRFIDSGYAKVQSQGVNKGFKSYDLDIPTPDGITVLGDVVGLIIFYGTKRI